MGGSVVSQPSITVAIANANQAVQNTAQKVLAVGQIGPAATALTGVLQTNVQDDFDTLFDPRSQLAGILRAYKRVNPVVMIDALPLDDDGSGVPRVLSFTLVGPATAAGTVTLVLGSELDHKLEVAVADGDTATEIGAAITAAAALDLKAPFTVGDAVGVVTITAANDGTVANDLGVEVIVDAAGVTISVALTEDTPGSVDPTLTGILDFADSVRYQAIIWPFADTSVLRTHLTPKFNPTNDVLDGVGFVTLQDAHATLLTTLNALNDQDLVAFTDKQESIAVALVSGYLGPAQNEASYVKSALFAGIRALRLTEDQVISQFLTSSASLDQFGGAASASLPYFNTPMTFLPLVPIGRGWTRTEIEQLGDAGGSVMGVNTAGNGALVGEVFTTYKTDTAGNPDVTFEFLNYVDTASGAREYFFSNLRARFAQSRLTEGAVSRGRDMANVPVINAFLDKLYLDLAGPDFVLAQDGEAAIAFFKANRVTVLDLASGKATITMLFPIVTQLRTIIATLKIAFSTVPA